MPITITVTLPDEEAEALAEMLKRIGWSDWRALSVSDDQAYRMRYACEAVAHALAEAGHAPR